MYVITISIMLLLIVIMYIHVCRCTDRYMQPVTQLHHGNIYMQQQLYTTTWYYSTCTIRNAAVVLSLLGRLTSLSNKEIHFV